MLVFEIKPHMFPSTN